MKRKLQPLKETLSTSDLTPVTAGKGNFYFTAVNHRFGHAGDRPSISLILCRKQSRVIADFDVSSVAELERGLPLFLRIDHA